MKSKTAESQPGHRTLESAVVEGVETPKFRHDRIFSFLPYSFKQFFVRLTTGKITLLENLFKQALASGHGSRDLSADHVNKEVNKRWFAVKLSQFISEDE